jgi:benzoyl-CoA reductase/2-hydroxyglutaryl-CoA dehydratase subunit BcrC/BadD/HgdB
MTEEKNVYKILADSFSSIVAYMEKKSPERKWAYEPSAKHWAERYRAKEVGKPIAWYNFGIPPEIFVAMDILPQQIEHITATTASFPEAKLTERIDTAHQYVPDYICTAHKHCIGALIDGSVPKPDVVVGSSHPCDSSREGHSIIAGYFDIPYFPIDIPYWDDEASYQYVADQIEEMVSFLEKTTGRNLDLDKLRQVVGYSNEAQRYILQIRELRKTIPCPSGGSDLLIDAGVNASMVGTPEAVEYFKNRYERAKEKVDKKEGIVPKERLRIVYVYTPTFFNPELLTWLERQYSAVVVTDLMDYRLYEPIEDLSSFKAIYRGLARKTMALPMAMHFRGPADYFLDFAVNTCRDYKADAAIFTGGIACRSAWAVAKLAKDVLRDKLNMPMLSIVVDVADPRIVPDQEMRGKIEDFLSVILN